MSEGFGESRGFVLLRSGRYRIERGRVRNEIRVYGKWSKQLQRSEVVKWYKVEVEVQELVLGRDKCRHARGVPGFARIPCPASRVSTNH